MELYSTEGSVAGISLDRAITEGFAPNGGLYLPQNLPCFSRNQIHQWRGLSFLELSIEIAKTLFSEELTPQQIERIFEVAFDFPLPLFAFEPHCYCLELFHGPTLSFKDFGARLLAQYMHVKQLYTHNHVLVATTGDTGSAVGAAFHGLPHFFVSILFSKGEVTVAQEQQLTTIGGNVQAYAVDGSFEQCQQLVKEACQDPSCHATTANSINIMRLLAQALYYFYAYLETGSSEEAIFSVPCGNFGDLVSGVLAKRMGLPIHQMIAATNINDEVPRYLETGFFEPHPAYKTIAISMDVGDPSNFPRLLSLYDGSVEKMRQEITGFRCTDDEIRGAIAEMYGKHGYLLDPHSAVGYLALEKKESRLPRIFFGTAHPAKFSEALDELIPVSISIPEALSTHFNRPKSCLSLEPSLESLKSSLKMSQSY